MKKHNLVLFALAGVLITQGCSNKSADNASSPAVAAVPNTAAPVLPPTLPVVQPSGASTAPQIGTNGTVVFTPVSKAVMEAYVASHPLNNPTDFRVTINLRHVGNLRYGGDVKISYVDNGQTYMGVFNAPEGVNSSDYALLDAGKMKAEYNYWHVLGGQTVFSGFFQDTYGGIVLTIENTVNLGDGQGSSTVSGSIWFRNFAYSFAPQSTHRNCWFIYMGPYDCRSDSIISKSSLVPTNGYTKLGTFSGLVTSQAFQ